MTTISNEPPPDGAPGTMEVDRAKNQPGALCVRCNHLNYLGQEHCERCGAHLYVKCPRCGEPNMRVYTRCHKCRRRLRRRGLFHSHHSSRKKTLLRKVGWHLLEVLLVLAALGIIFGILYLIYLI